MKLAALVVVLALYPSASLAWNYCSRGVPPVEFQHEPQGVRISIYDMPPDLIHVVCKVESRPLRWASACVEEVDDGVFFIRIRNDVGATERACLLVHEKAHINGWRHWEPEKATRYPVPGSRFRRPQHYDRYVPLSP